MTRPTLFLLHSLGASAREWDGVIERLGDAFTCVALDLPGFGARVDDGRTDIAAMLGWLADTVRAYDPAAWMPVGHSMGGKLATLLAARAEAGERGLAGLAGIVLLEGSPPGPEPMDETRRADMLGWFAEGPAGVAEAREFVRANTAASLPEPLLEKAVADVRRSGRHAWLAWLERGSREDWRGQVDRIATPALLMCGDQGGDLGEDAQRRLNMPLFRDGRLAAITGAGHLLPYERPEAVADAIAAHWARIRGRTLPPDLVRLLGSDRVSARTRRTLLARLDDPGTDLPGVLSDAQLAVLRSVADRVLPGRREGGDLARRIDVALAAGDGDGWRFAELPPDPDAWRRGIDTLESASDGFATLPAEGQEVWLRRMMDGEVGGDGEGRLSPAGMKLWFEDVRAALVRAWLSHPATMARIGYDGFANGGDGPRPQGFTRLAADDAEPWQLRPEGEAA